MGTGFTRISQQLFQSEAVTFALIVAVAENGVIGREGELPWRLSSDLRYFKSVTMGKPIIMGRKTFDSIGRPLPGRTNIVVSRNPDFSFKGVDVFNRLEAAVSHAEGLVGAEIMVIGGAGLYEAALPTADRIYLTEVHFAVDGDVFFPSLDRVCWAETSRERHPAGEKDDHDHSFVILDRVTSV